MDTRQSLSGLPITREAALDFSTTQRATAPFSENVILTFTFVLLRDAECNVVVWWKSGSNPL